MKDSSDPNRHNRSDYPERPDQVPPDSAPEDIQSGEDDLDFVVTEAHNQDHELVGGVTPPPKSTEDDLGIQSAADLMEKEAHRDSDTAKDIPIGESAVTAPPPPDYSYQQPPQEELQVTRNNMEPPDEPDRIKRLSEEQLQEISQKMKLPSRKTDYLTEDEKFDLLRGLDQADGESHPKGFDNTPIVPPKKTAQDSTEPPAAPVVPEDVPEAKPPMARRVRGVAYFTKSFIQITGEQELHEDDELSVNGREYLLKRKRFSNKMLLATLGPIAALLIFWVGVLFVADVNTGEGRVVGVVVDDNQQPVLVGASVRFPDIDREFKANAQGFFKTDPMEAGSMRIEYLYDGEVVGRDYATVVDGQITTIVMTPNVPEQEPQAQTSPRRSTKQFAQTPPPVENSTASTEKSSSSTPARKETKTSPDKKSTPQYSKLTLIANVGNAKLAVDGSVLGAGNLTYSRIKPGKHSFAVSKEGFETATGSFTVNAGNTKSLQVELVPATAAAKRAVYDAKDFFLSAKNNLELGDYETALQDLDQAIAKSPSYADAYQARAAIYQSRGQLRPAHDDYIRAAEIMRFRGESSESISAYNKAIEIDPESVGGYLGRGNLFLEQGQDIAAITDFDMVVGLDKRNLQAHLGLGEARYSQGSYGKAIKHFKEARSLAPDDPTVHQYLMLAYLADGDIKQVNKSYEKYLKCASEEEAQKLKSDPEFSAVMRVIKED